jgi:CheY-like chemotaxis protein
VLNGKADSKDYAKSTDIIRFTFPRARMLVVDDIATNLKVAEGLLAPYSAVVDTCLSGSQAVEMAKQAASEKHDYDIIFMDHMMPVMDGIEAAALIRAWEKAARRRQVPIIALTANAVVGMREMFIENGFNDYLSKPIDISKMDEILDRWIPKEKREQGIEGIRDQGLGTGERDPVTIPGVDMEKGIAMTGGTEAGYRNVLSIFCKDVENRLPQLQTVPETDTLNDFIIHVHALKSASASIGAEKLSAQAAVLETAGKAGDIGFIRDNLSVFVKCLSELTEGILANDSEEQAATGGACGDLDNAKVMPLLHELAEALKSQKGDVIDRILEQIARQPLDTGVKTAVDKIADEVLIAEYEKALEILDFLLIINLEAKNG